MELTLTGFLPSLIAIAVSFLAVIVYTSTQEELIKLVMAIVAAVGLVLSLTLAHWIVLSGLILLVLKGWKLFPKELLASDN
ncbi:hypothetical protein [Lyngbya sp. CCY1209]|jgi:hypothetical protein|uniref:hypothetical protein n=1 Tax=Lyngbya sp. CCY1209 TaxID=2886103 RepID=UPI002D20B999|nr:hypothetical protein [Lyngbya sp. CCY1209]MEB3885312.1 hypothetical protein [Lyngbya sp. CCY1209]